MKEWLDKRMLDWNAYNVRLNETRTHENVTHFWLNDAKKEEESQDQYWRIYHLMIEGVGPKEYDITRAGVKAIQEEMEGNSSQVDIDAAVKAYEKTRVVEKVEAYRKAYQEILDGTRADNIEPV